MKINKQKGFIVPLAIGIIAVFIIGGAYGWYSPVKKVGTPRVETIDGQTYQFQDYAPTWGQKGIRATSTATIDATKDWKTYTNTQYGFEFKYPKEITFPPFSSTSRNVFIVANQASNTDKSVGLYISTIEGSGGKVLKDEKELLSKQADVQEIIINGNPALKINDVEMTVSDTGGGESYTASAIIETFKGRYLYSFQCSQNGRSLNDCNQIISTFKFIN